MAEYKHFDGEDFITFNILSLDFDKNEITVAITNRGKITVSTYEILKDMYGDCYFEYGPFTSIFLMDFYEEER